MTSQLSSDLDELNLIVPELAVSESAIDDARSIFIQAYRHGHEDGCGMAGYDYAMSMGAMSQAIGRVTEGKTADERIQDIIDGTTDSPLSAEEQLKRVIETEYHRIYNTAIFDVAEEYGRRESSELSKLWVTQGDDRVRDTHVYLQGMAVPYSDRFYTYDGDSGMFPGDFGRPENNINCRCYILLKP